MRTLAQHLCTAALLLTSACERSAIDPSQSLVDAKHLPPAKVLSREIIYLSRGYGSPNSRRLSYELHPDNSLVVTLTAKNFHTTQDQQTFRLSPSIAANARQSLWRLRPEELKGVEWETKPTGCRSDVTDDFPEFAVAFIAEGPKPGVEDDRVGATSIPYRSSCSSRQALEASSVVLSVLRLFPQSKVASEYDQLRGRVR